MRVTQKMLVCDGGACHGTLVTVLDGVGARLEVVDAKGHSGWYVVLRDGEGKVHLAHDAVQKAMADELVEPEETCALCGGSVDRTRVPGADEFDIDCPKCGSYTVGANVTRSMLFRPRTEIADFMFAVREANEAGKRLALPGGAEKPLRRIAPHQRST
jgi:hypothetical protein